jgi:hypothetical protein
MKMIIFPLELSPAMQNAEKKLTAPTALVEFGDEVIHGAHLFHRLFLFPGHAC